MCCNKNYKHKFNKNLRKRLFNAYSFSKHDNNKFILLLQKGVYPFKYVGDWEKFTKISLLGKKDFCSYLNMENITDVDYTHAIKVSKDFEIKNLEEHHDFYVQSDILLLGDVFENFQKMYLKIYKLYKLLSASGLASPAAFKKTKTILDLWTMIWYYW